MTGEEVREMIAGQGRLAAEVRGLRLTIAAVGAALVGHFLSRESASALRERFDQIEDEVGGLKSS